MKKYVVVKSRFRRLFCRHKWSEPQDSGWAFRRPHVVCVKCGEARPARAVGQPEKEKIRLAVHNKTDYTIDFVSGAKEEHRLKPDESVVIGVKGQDFMYIDQAE